MAHIHNQPDTVHLCNHFAAHAGDTAICAFITARGQKRLIIIGQLHKARTKTMPDFHQADIIFNRRRVLKAKQNGGTPVFFGLPDIGGGESLTNPVRIGFKPAIPLFQIQNRFTKIFVISDGDMHTINLTLLHFGENLF